MWKPVAAYPAAQGVEALYGKRLRARRTAELQVFTPEGLPHRDQTISVRIGWIEFIGRPVGSDVVVALPRSTLPLTATINRLALNTFDSIRVNWATLQNVFEIEA